MVFLGSEVVNEIGQLVIYYVLDVILSGLYILMFLMFRVSLYFLFLVD